MEYDRQSYHARRESVANQTRRGSIPEVLPMAQHLSASSLRDPKDLSVDSPDQNRMFLSPHRMTFMLRNRGGP